MKKELILKSAGAFEKLGDPIEALHEYCMSDDWENVMRVALKMSGNIESWTYLDRVPADILIKDADLSAQCFMYNIGNLNVERCQLLFEKFKENYEGTDVFRVIQFAEVYVSKDIRKIPEYPLLFSAKQIDGLPFGHVAKSMIFVENAAALTEHMNYKEAELCIDKAIKTSGSGNNFVNVFALGQKAQLLEEVGRLNESLECYKKIIGLFETLSTMSAIGINFYIGMTGVYMRRMELDKAEKALRHSHEIWKQQHNRISVIDMTIAFHMAEMNFLKGNDNAGAAFVEKVFSEYPSFSILGFGRLVHELDCAGLLRPELADAFISKLAATTDLKHQPFMRLLNARLQFKKGSKEFAFKETEEVSVFARENKNRLRLVEADLLKIFMLSQYEETTERKRQIGNLLREAVYYAYENRIIMPFFLERRIVLPLLRELSNQNADKSILSAEESAFVIDTILACRNISSSSKSQEILSARELEVLSELSHGLTNREIAEKLCISQATVKTHLLNIFGKLGVSTRLLAVEEGRKRGLII